MDKTIKNITPKQSRAIATLMAGGSVVQAAEAAKVSRGTVYTWLDQKQFTEAMNDAKADVMDQLAISLAALGEKAIRTLEAAMDDTRAGVSVKVRAADIVIARILDLKDLVDFECRLADLEATVSIRNKGQI